MGLEGERVRVVAANRSLRKSATSSGYTLHMTTVLLAKNLYLMKENEDGFFSDNYFDLLPGDEITVLLSTEMDLETLKGGVVFCGLFTTKERELQA